MTTIAWDAASGVMAADTQATYGNFKLRSRKVERMKCGGLVGAAGPSSQCAKIVRWVLAGMPAKSQPDFGDDDADFECVYVTGKGEAHLLLPTLEPIPLSNDFVAIGSGGAYAIAAMHCGLTAEQAVGVAAVYDPCTSGPVEVFKLTKPRGRKKAK